MGPGDIPQHRGRRTAARLAAGDAAHALRSDRARSVQYPGAYNDPTLSTLYSQLLAKGSMSSDDALAVGATLETKGIADFEAALAATAKLDVKQVYSNLMSASYRHLDASQNGCRMVAAK